ncbi:MAG: addiction module toxin RelE [archaeon]
MYGLLIKPKANKIFQKLSKTHPERMRMIGRKLDEIRANPSHVYKFLRKPYQTFNRVHIDKHFVLIFKIEHKERVVDVYFFGHHDYAYRGSLST